jgi:hypothetical protein
VTETPYDGQVWRESLYDSDWTDPANTMRRIMASSVATWSKHRQVLRTASEMAARAPVIREQWAAAAEESADSIADMIVASTTIEALRDHDAARRMMVTLVWMLERNCYMHSVYENDESDAALSLRLSDICIRALGLE